MFGLNSLRENLGNWNRSISYEKNFGGFWKRKTWRDDFRSFSRCSCERWMRIGVGGDSGGGKFWLLFSGWPGKAEKVFLSRSLKTSLCPRSWEVTNCSQYTVFMPSRRNIEGCVLCTKHCGRTCRWYEDELNTSPFTQAVNANVCPRRWKGICI